MKKQLIIIAGFVMVTGLFLSNAVMGQWATSGSDIYNTNSGNVGIGTSTPTWLLHVYNATSYSAIVAESPYSDQANRAIGIFRMKNSATGDFYNISLRKNSGVTQCVQNAFVAGYGAVDISLFDYSTRKLETKSGVTDITYTNSGNIFFNNTGGVGIGVTSLGTGVKLQVTGKIKCQEVEVAVTPWPDHVFQTNYSLMPLSEVEYFISKNNHLPGVPSGTEVLEKGINLGNMDAILLQKIEELTLYVIDLKKENDQLKERMKNLKN